MPGGKPFPRALTTVLVFLVAFTLGAQADGVDRDRIFAPYVDMGKANINLPEIQAASGARWFTLAFINAGDGCLPKWQGGKGLAEDEIIPGYIEAVRRQGGDVIVAFGGYDGTELAQACTDEKSLEAAYQQVISRYHAKVLDFDVEHLAIEDQASIDRRSLVLKRLAAANPKLRIQFTLPATPSGLTPQAVNVLKSAVAHKVPLAVVNIMAMDYGMPIADGEMGKNVISAAEGAQKQLNALGIKACIGITPMIGMNDSAGETFTLADAKAVVDYALGNPRVALLAFWSVGRDNGSCGPSVSPACSGIEQETWAFTEIFRRFR